MFSNNVKKIFDEIKADKENEDFTKAGIDPLFSAPESAKVIIVGQAPGIKAQEAKKYWFDRSGDRLREWECIKRHFMIRIFLRLYRWIFITPVKAKAVICRQEKILLLNGIPYF